VEIFETASTWEGLHIHIRKNISLNVTWSSIICRIILRRQRKICTNQHHFLGAVLFGTFDSAIMIIQSHTDSFFLSEVLPSTRIWLVAPLNVI
jgi:uncharacterized membrane protein YczE